MMHRATTASAPTGQRNPAQGKESSGDALDQVSLNTLILKEAEDGVKLRRGWSEQRIEQLFAPLEDGRTLHQGWSPQCDKVPSPSEDVWGVLKTTSIQAGEFQPEHNKRLPSGLEPRPMIEVKEGDILLTCAGPRARCGVSCLVRRTRRRLMMSGKMYRFRVDPDRTDARYVEAFLQTERARLAIDKMKTGSSDSGLNLTHARFRKLLLPVAPLDEQRRIVAEIEKQLTRLEAGVTALRRVQANLKRYRAAVLKAACEGRLVPIEAELAKAENRNFETGEELLARILTERRQNWRGRGSFIEPASPDTDALPQLPAGWTWVRIEQLSNVVRGASPRPAGDPRYFGGSVPWITVGPLTADNSPYLNSVPASLNELGREHSRYVEPQTLLLTNSGATLGVPKITLIGGCINDGVAALLDVGYPLKLYLLYFLRTQTGRLRGVNQGAAQPNLNTTIIKDIRVPLPPLAEQTRIVAEVERRLSVIEELESVVSRDLHRAMRLRQSILQEAFAENHADPRKH
jgi:type I restriction enzyme S subunit